MNYCVIEENQNCQCISYVSHSWGCVLVYRYTKERNIDELCGYENNRNSPVYRYTRTAPIHGM